MAAVTMTVHEALTRKVLLEKQLASISNLDVYSYRQGARMEMSADAPDVYIAKARSAFAQLVARVENLKALKAAIVQSNATTMVVVGGREMTVAAAIEYRRSSIKIEREILRVLTLQYELRSKQLANARRTTAAEAEKVAQNIMGSNTSKEHPDFKTMVDQYLASREWSAVDPIEIEKVIALMSQRLDEFETSVDSVLTASNVSTQITVHMFD